MRSPPHHRLGTEGLGDRPPAHGRPAPTDSAFAPTPWSAPGSFRLRRAAGAFSAVDTLTCRLGTPDDLIVATLAVRALPPAP
ncbi:MAG: hypothetical protein M3063_02220 [Actinomycetota bacterium]|nr:hypothetical protein [Actinomycetota bacterium]